MPATHVFPRMVDVGISDRHLTVLRIPIVLIESSEAKPTERVAQAAATSAALMPGRFFLGVGTGENLNEHILGDRWPAPTSAWRCSRRRSSSCASCGRARRRRTAASTTRSRVPASTRFPTSLRRSQSRPQRRRRPSSRADSGTPSSRRHRSETWSRNSSRRVETGSRSTGCSPSAGPRRRRRRGVRRTSGGRTPGSRAISRRSYRCRSTSSRPRRR